MKPLGYDLTPLPIDLGPAFEKQMVESKAKAKPGVAWLPCPDCTHLGAAVVRDGDHLVWREHWVKTYGNAQRQCRASGQRLCDLPQRKMPQGKPLACPCAR